MLLLWYPPVIESSCDCILLLVHPTLTPSSPVLLYPLVTAFCYCIVLLLNHPLIVLSCYCILLLLNSSVTVSCCYCILLLLKPPVIESSCDCTLLLLNDSVTCPHCGTHSISNFHMCLPQQCIPCLYLQLAWSLYNLKTKVSADL